MTAPGLYASLFAGGLAASLHCIGMCGPILAGFSRAIRPEAGGRPRPALEFLWYHLGRIWTYALLGLAAGAGGRSAVLGAAFIGRQRQASVALAALVIAGGALLLLPPPRRLATWAGGCGFGRLAAVGWFRQLLAMPAPLARLLTGAVMGLLPCGLVYAMLAVAASLATPLEGALAMIAFGLGTVPSLTGVLLAAGAVPVRLRAQGTRLAAVLVLATGAWMMTRAIAVTPGPGGCVLCEPGHSTDRPSGSKPSSE